MMTFSIVFLSSLLQPALGLFVWVAFTFLLLVFLLGKFAWGPILNGLKEREEGIRDALSSADKARQEMANLQSDNQKLLNEAKEAKNNILREAREIKDTIINEAREKAKSDAAKIIEEARLQIQNEKMAALTDVKNQIGKLSLEVAEKILRKELANKAESESYVNNLTKEIKLN